MFEKLCLNVSLKKLTNTNLARIIVGQLSSSHFGNTFSISLLRLSTNAKFTVEIFRIKEVNIKFKFFERLDTLHILKIIKYVAVG